MFGHKAGFKDEDTPECFKEMAVRNMARLVMDAAFPLDLDLTPNLGLTSPVFNFGEGIVTFSFEPFSMDPLHDVILKHLEVTPGATEKDLNPSPFRLELRAPLDPRKHFRDTSPFNIMVPEFITIDHAALDNVEKNRALLHRAATYSILELSQIMRLYISRYPFLSQFLA